MTVTQGTRTLSSEYNTLNTAVNKWFGDNYSSVTFGDGNQTYGWGGTNSSVAGVGDNKTTTQMNRLTDRCNIGTDIVNNVTGQLSQISGNILASEYNTIETKAALIDTNKLDIDPLELSLLTGDNSVRTTDYSAMIDCIFSYTQASFTKQRHFWNSGGAINVSGTITGYSTGEGFDGAGINEILTDMGTVTMNYTETTQSGSGGTTTSIGYYDLTTSYQLIFSQTGTGAYSDAYVYVYAKLTTSTGDVVDFKVEAVPESGRTVDGTTTITSQYRILDDQSSGVASLIITDPTALTTNELE